MEVNPLIPIGTKIQVDKSNIENLLPNKLLNELPEIINGQIIDYKMTDGMGIGYVLRTENNQKIWIFNTELNAQTIKEYKPTIVIEEMQDYDYSDILLPLGYEKTKLENRKDFDAVYVHRN